MIRVNAGKYKGRKIEEPNPLTTRPSKDIVKVGLFNIIRNEVLNCTFLDLFAGSGQIGIEALSRNAKKVYFIEKDRNAFKILKNNLSYVPFNDYEVINNDFKLFLDNSLNLIKFDIIFVDPPYKMEINDEFISNLISNYLNDSGILIFEREEKFNDELNDKYSFKEYKYGRSKLYIYRKL